VSQRTRLIKMTPERRKRRNVFFCAPATQNHAGGMHKGTPLFPEVTSHPNENQSNQPPRIFKRSVCQHLLCTGYPPPPKRYTNSDPHTAEGGRLHHEAVARGHNTLLAPPVRVVRNEPSLAKPNTLLRRHRPAGLPWHLT